jgi:hypothetical protein
MDKCELVKLWEPFLLGFEKDIKTAVHEDNPNCDIHMCPEDCALKLENKVNHRLDLSTSILWEVCYIIRYYLNERWTAKECCDRLDTLEVVIQQHEDDYEEVCEYIREVSFIFDCIRKGKTPDQRFDD